MRLRNFATFILLVIASCTVSACDEIPVPISRTGVTAAPPAKILLGSDGLTIEQKNINDRLHNDNLPGSTKHLYVISAYSGQVILYSTVRGKVTSSGKRSTPSNVNGSVVTNSNQYGSFPVSLGEQTYFTNEVLGDDGTYGPSAEYLYWWDSKGAYHQHYTGGGQIVHISDQPMAVKSIIINTEEVK